MQSRQDLRVIDVQGKVIVQFGRSKKFRLKSGER